MGFLSFSMGFLVKSFSGFVVQMFEFLQQFTWASSDSDAGSLDDNSVSNNSSYNSSVDSQYGS